MANSRYSPTSSVGVALRGPAVELQSVQLAPYYCRIRISFAVIRGYSSEFIPIAHETFAYPLRLTLGVWKAVPMSQRVSMSLVVSEKAYQMARVFPSCDNMSEPM